VTYRSVFGTSRKNPPQWKAAFERANLGLHKELVEALEPAWQVASEAAIASLFKLEKWRWAWTSLKLGLQMLMSGLSQNLSWKSIYYQMEKSRCEQEFLLPQGAGEHHIRERSAALTMSWLPACCSE
jgi:hypothetical protein